MGPFAPTPTFNSVSTNHSLPWSQGGLWHTHCFGRASRVVTTDYDQIPSLQSAFKTDQLQDLMEVLWPCWPWLSVLQSPRVCSSESGYPSAPQAFEHTSLFQDTMDLVFPVRIFPVSPRYHKPQLLSANCVTIASFQLLLVVFFLLSQVTVFLFCIALWYTQIFLLFTCICPFSPRRQAGFLC